MNEHHWWYVKNQVIDTTGYLSWLYALPAEGPHVTRSGPILYQTRPALKACCGNDYQWQSTVYFSVARRMIYFGYQNSYGLMCVIYFGITEDLVKCTLGSCTCGHVVWAVEPDVTDTERMYMAWLLSWWDLPSNLFWHCTLGLFLLNALFCAFNISLCCGLCQEDPL